MPSFLSFFLLLSIVIPVCKIPQSTHNSSFCIFLVFNLLCCECSIVSLTVDIETVPEVMEIVFVASAIRGQEFFFICSAHINLIQPIHKLTS